MRLQFKFTKTIFDGYLYMKDKIKKGDEKMCKTELNEMLATAIQQVKDAEIGRASCRERV